MFVVTEAEAAAIRAMFEQRGEFAAAVELRRRFPGIADTAQALECARTIAGWQPLRPVRRLGYRGALMGPCCCPAPTIRRGGTQLHPGARGLAFCGTRIGRSSRRAFAATALFDTPRRCAIAALGKPLRHSAPSARTRLSKV